MGSAQILITILLVLAVIISWVAFIMAYIMYVNYRKKKPISKKLYAAFFTSLILALVFYLVWGFSQNLDLPPWAVELL